MNILKNKMNSLVLKGNKILSVFEKTKKELLDINFELSMEEEERLSKMEDISNELAIISEHKDKNNKIIKNIDKFFD